MTTAAPKPNVLFLCTGNSCRSQMAEGWGRHFHADKYIFYSAGIETHGLNPYAVKVMAEAGVDISHHRSKHLKELLDIPFDYVITVCSHADENCPIFPQKTIVVHRGFNDPAKYVKLGKGEDEIWREFRRVRDEIKEFVKGLPEYLKGMESGVGSPDPTP